MMLTIKARRMMLLGFNWNNVFTNLGNKIIIHRKTIGYTKSGRLNHSPIQQNRSPLANGIDIIWMGRPINFHCTNINKTTCKQYGACCIILCKSTNFVITPCIAPLKNLLSIPDKYYPALIFWFFFIKEKEHRRFIFIKWQSKANYINSLNT